MMFQVETAGMKPKKRLPKEMGKPGRLVQAIIWTLCAVLFGVQLRQALLYGTASNAPGWPVNALATAGSALCAVCWLISWLRYDKTHQKASNQDILGGNDHER